MRIVDFDFIPNRSEWGYTKVNNCIFRDNTTTLEERGMYMLLCQLMDFISKDGRQWELSGVGLSKILKDSDKKIRAVYNRLADKKYLAIEQRKIRGRFYGVNEWKVLATNSEGLQEQHYTIVDNAVFREQLSLKELGLIGTLMFLPKEYPATVRNLSLMLQESSGTIQKYRKNIEKRGYFELIDQENSNGIFGTVQWTMHPISYGQKRQMKKRKEERLKAFKERWYKQMQRVVRKIHNTGKQCIYNAVHVGNQIQTKLKEMGSLIQEFSRTVCRQIHENREICYADSS